MKVVSNSTPLIALEKIGKLEILRKIFTEIYIPESVYREVYESPKTGMQKPDWVRTSSVTNKIAVESLLQLLDRGEAETLVLAQEFTADRVLMDDRKGFKIGRSLNLLLLRTTDILEIAFQLKLISDLKRVLLDLKQKGYWISDFYIEKILNNYGIDL